MLPVETENVTVGSTVTFDVECAGWKNADRLKPRMAVRRMISRFTFRP